MKVLAIDPGYERLGVAVVEHDERGKEVLLYSDCFTTSRELPFTKRLQAIGDEVVRLIKKYNPDTFALEDLFFNTNQKTAMQVSEVRGALRYIASTHSLPIYEYTPLQVKIATTGYGRSDKKQLIVMIPKLISIEKDIRHDDEYDAIGVALTCLASQKMEGL